jgi:hypothetical protein
VNNLRGLLFKKPNDNQVWLLYLKEGIPEYLVIDDTDETYKEMTPYDAEIVEIDDSGRNFDLLTLRGIQNSCIFNGDKRVTVWEAINYALDTELGVLEKLVSGTLSST